MKDIIVRKMCINDFNQVHKLVEQVHKLHLNERKNIYRNVDPLPFDEFKKYLREHQYFCFVAVVNDVIVGEIISEIKEVKEDGIFKQRRFLFIEDICIDKNYTRKGIGRKLCDMAKQLARKENVSSIELNVWAFNKNAIAYQNDKTNYLYYQRITRFDFTDFNEIYESNLLRKIGKIMNKY